MGVVMSDFDQWFYNQAEDPADELDFEEEDEWTRGDFERDWRDER